MLPLRTGSRSRHAPVKKESMPLVKISHFHTSISFCPAEERRHFPSISLMMRIRRTKKDHKTGHGTYKNKFNKFFYFNILSSISKQQNWTYLPVFLPALIRLASFCLPPLCVSPHPAVCRFAVHKPRCITVSSIRSSGYFCSMEQSSVLPGKGKTSPDDLAYVVLPIDPPHYPVSRLRSGAP